MRYTVADFATPEKAFQTTLDFQVEVPGPFEPFMLDAAAIERCKAILGLTWPLEIEFGGVFELGWSALAVYRTTKPVKFPLRPDFEDEPIHRIYCRDSQAVDAEMASLCLWHELTHAQQAEELGSPKALWDWVSSFSDYDSVQADTDREKYLRHPAEYPAFAQMRYHFDHFPLTMRV